MKSCYYHSDFYRFKKGEYYDYYNNEELVPCIWVIYDNYGDYDNSGYRFFVKVFGEFFITMCELRSKKLKRIYNGIICGHCN